MGGKPQYMPFDFQTGKEQYGPPSSMMVPQSEGQKEVAVRTSIDPIQVNVQQSTPLSGTVNVNITGTINGPVGGTGSGAVTGAAQGSSNVPRGESMPVETGVGGN